MSPSSYKNVVRKLKMNKAVIDSSALIAFLKDESFSLNELEPILSHGVISSVNACEVATVLARLGMPITIIDELINETIGAVVSFDKELSLAAAKLWELTKSYGLSLGDRACIALGQKLQLPIYTADKIWKEVNLDNIDIRLIR